jgi:hypothetical protein
MKLIDILLSKMLLLSNSIELENTCGTIDGGGTVRFSNIDIHKETQELPSSWAFVDLITMIFPTNHEL